jgi:hypothetical protein
MGKTVNRENKQEMSINGYIKVKAWERFFFIFWSSWAKKAIITVKRQ